VLLYAFDLLELNGDDLRETPLEDRKRRLERMLRKSPGGILFNEHLDSDGAEIFKHSCKLGLEGIVSSSLSRMRP
jgi:bifunctional non-homologous end joining protein LigD